MKILEFKTDGNTFSIKGKLEGNLTIDDIDVFYDVKATKNGKPENIFGETFVGHKIDAYDLLSAGIAAYFNDNQNVEFTYVCDTIKNLKKNSQTFTYSVGERKFPDFVISPNGQLHKLTAITQSSDGLGNAYYHELYKGELTDESVIMTRYDGSVASDIEPIATCALIQSALEGDKFIYVESMTKDWLINMRRDEGLSPELKTA